MSKDLRLNIFFCLLFVSLLHPVHSRAAGPDSGSGNGIITAVTLYDSGDMKGAGRVLSALLAEDESNDAAWYYLALVSLYEGDAATAEECLRKATELDPDNYWYRYRLAGLYAVTHREELTIGMYESLLKDFPKKSELYFDLVELYSAQKEYQKALDTLQEIETVFGVTESIAMYRFNLLHMMGRQEEAYQSLEKYNSEYSSPFVLSTLADYHMSTYNDSTALAYYNEALDIAPDYSPALLGKAETFRLTRRYDEYFKLLDRYVSLSDSPASAKSDYLMAVVQRTDPKFIHSFLPQLDSVMTKVVSVHPSDSSVLQAAGLYFYSTDRRPQAKEYFRRNAETWPESLSASANFVEFLMYSEDWEALSEEGRKAYDRFPKEPAFLEMASVGDYNLEDYDKVLQICSKVLEVAPKDSSRTVRAWSTMGDVLYKTGESKKAYKAYEKALKVNPDYAYVLNNYAYFLSLDGRKLKKAYEMSRRTIEAEPDNSTYLDTYGWILHLLGKDLEAKPVFKHAMLYGGKDSAVILDHYAEVLYALKEYDMAFVYWNLAMQKNDGEVPELQAKIESRKKDINR